MNVILTLNGTGPQMEGFFPSNGISVIWIRITSGSDFKQAVEQEDTLGLASSPFLTFTHVCLGEQREISQYANINVAPQPCPIP